MQHHVNVRAAVADVNDSIGGHAEAPAERIDRGNLAVAGGNLNDAFDLAGLFIEPEVTADDMIRRNDSLQRRIDDEPRRSGDDIEIETESVDAVFQKIGEQRDVPFQANAASDFDQVLFTHRTKVRIVSQ